MADERRWHRPESFSDWAKFLADFEIINFVCGVLPILELNNTHFFELMAQPLVVAVKKSELLTVRHDLCELHLLEQLALWVLQHDGSKFFGADTKAIPYFLLQEAVTHTNACLVSKLLTVLHFGI